MCVCVSCVARIDGVMRTMSTEKLIKTLPIIQNQLDALLDFQVPCVCPCLCARVFVLHKSVSLCMLDSDSVSNQNVN